MTELTFLHGVQESPVGAERLPRGHHDLTSEFVAGHQRTRILEATTAVLREHGYVETTVAQIVRRARVSRRTFYENFENKTHCCLATFGNVTECCAASVREAYRGDSWADRLAGSFADLGRLLVEHPDPTYTVLVEMNAAGREADERRSDALALCGDGLRASLEGDGPAAAPLSPIAVDLAVGGLLGALAERLRTQSPAKAAAALPEAVERTLAPLVGERPAADVAARLRAALPAVAVARRTTA